ncbi:Competence CoiA family protein [Apilactobacillus ozensis DSM 23829 = JCM 17196]|uniref:Competence CoiA family protein n=1 Tax=Apilactobacillus ozensis DSM 23829 = JCM 17196 TaxID=1423781 RepID=A0A0R2AX40_9LACO|nr:competence protein CoiA family protein [Apilactobacillus ozensis]KRM68619.1 Competence CoiA family protein [Apilactobacillus ozensis DSM 23829 = JCM 17196]
MLTANDENNHKVFASRKLNSQRYFCTSCGNPVFIKLGNFKCAHFAHFSNYNCNINNESETNEHIIGKLAISKFLHKNNVFIEKYLPSIKQRPDIMFDDNVVEFQCSSINIKRLNERNDGYSKLKIKYFWILGSKYYQNKFNQSIKKFYTYSIKLGFYILFWDFKSSELIVNYQISMIDGKIIFKEQRFSDWNSFLVFKSKMNFGQFIIRNSLIYSIKKIEKDLFYKNKLLQNVQNTCYQNDFNLLTCPLLFHFPRRTIPLYKINPIFLRIYIFNILNNNSEDYVFNYVISNFINLTLVSPDIVARFIKNDINEYMNRLIKGKYITKINDIYHINRVPKDFLTFNDKINKVYKLNL